MAEHEKNSDVEMSIFAALDGMREQAVEMLSSLISIPSINPNYPGCDYRAIVGAETEANQLLARYYEDEGLEVRWVEREKGRANLIGILAGTHGSESRSLAINGHIDVVPPGSTSDWSTDPFRAVVTDGRIYGRGASDMKGGLVAAALATAALNRTSVRLGGNLFLHSVVGEETGDHDVGVKAVIEDGFGADAAIVAESTNHSIMPVSGGLLWMTLSVVGKAGHNNLRGELVHAGGQGEKAGVNALEKGVYLVGMIQELERQWGQSKSHPMFQPGWFSLHPGVMVSAPDEIRVPFMISTFCDVDYSILYPPNEDVESIKREIEDFVLGASQLDPWLRKNPPNVHWRLDWPPFETDVDHPIVDTVTRACRQALRGGQDGGLGQVTAFGAVCDATYFAEAGIPVVVYGGGPRQGGHKADEYTEVDRILTAAKTYALAAVDWCGARP